LSSPMSNWWINIGITSWCHLSIEISICIVCQLMRPLMTTIAFKDGDSRLHLILDPGTCMGTIWHDCRSSCLPKAHKSSMCLSADFTDPSAHM
jgi:hypothetical protein